MATPQERNTYDDLPYPSNPYRQTHPEHLAVLATLFGLSPPSPARCRVLELGCASGGNLIPMGATLPESTFYGIDLSGEQVREGLESIRALGLTNVRLEERSILDLDESAGEFDYILCHGVYSWVPEAVQEKILAICARQLAPNGIAYISYNTLPGWHMRGMIRDMMRYHVSRFRELAPLEKVNQARGLLSFLARSVSQSESPYSLLLRRELELLQQHSDSYLFHEHLEECNSPIYFLQFCERLTSKRLRYLGESEFHVMVPGTAFAPDVASELQALAPDLHQMEQYMDFVRNRQFRQSLVCRGSQHPRYDVRSETLFRFHLASPVKPKTEVDLTQEGSTTFLGRDDMALTAALPIVKSALCVLGEGWPLSFSFNDLVERARARLGTPPDGQEPVALARALLTAYATAGNRLVELSLLPRAYTTGVSDRPVAFPVARWQATVSQFVTNLRHDRVAISSLDRHMLPLLDGTHDRADLLDALVKKWEQGELTIRQDDQPVTDREEVMGILAEGIAQQLPRLATACLLVG